MEVLVQRKHRRSSRPARVNGMKIVPKARPMSTDEMIHLVEKARLEQDPEKVRQITDQIMDGFYGRKIVTV